MDSEALDSELMFRLCSGDERALRTLYRRHEAAVYGYALTRVDSSHDAVVVAAGAFSLLWEKRKSVRIVDNSVLPWLIVTTSNLARNANRSAIRYGRLLRRLPPAELFPDHASEVERVLDAERDSAPLRVAYKSLSSKEAEVLELCVLQGLTTAEAAVVLREPVGTVKARLSRTKAKLRDILNSQSEHELVEVKHG